MYIPALEIPALWGLACFGFFVFVIYIWPSWLAEHQQIYRNALAQNSFIAKFLVEWEISSKEREAEQAKPKDAKSVTKQGPSILGRGCYSLRCPSQSAPQHCHLGAPKTLRLNHNKAKAHPSCPTKKFCVGLQVQPKKAVNAVRTQRSTRSLMVRTHSSLAELRR